MCPKIYSKLLTIYFKQYKILIENGGLMNQRNISSVKAVFTFFLFTIYFYFLLYIVLPVLRMYLLVNTAIYWFIIGYLLFIPVFFTAIIMTRIEGNHNLKDIFSALNIKPFNKNDWKYSLIGIFLVIIFSGIIFFGSFLLNKHCGLRLLETKIWFMEIHPFKGFDKLLLLLWLPMFIFNIFGEELLWRGYIQSRLKNKNRWPICSVMWLLFHLPFGIDFMILLIPIVIIIPYIHSKTTNTLIGCFIHGLYNGPAFILIALGVIN
jgi:membrane protease YdiL (CAAX protease family)